jgi:hypothetical protein
MKKKGFSDIFPGNRGTKAAVWGYILFTLVFGLAGQYLQAQQTNPGLYVGNAFQGAMDLYDAVDWITKNAQSNGNYSIVLGRDSAIASVVLDCGGKKVSVSLKSTGGERNVTFASKSPSSALFTVKAGVTFTLENGVSLVGLQNDSWQLVRVDGGSFVMNGGVIKDSKGRLYNESTNDKGTPGCGVSIVNGTFTMNGGTISGNYSSGVSVSVDGTFTMTGGTISGNREIGVGVSGTFRMSGGIISGNFGGDGVSPVSVGGTFTMTGGTISGNSAGFGTVRVMRGTFTMNDGTISGNTGGGVSVENNGTFRMTGGTISGNTAGSGGGVHVSYGGSNTFTMTGGTISGNTAKESGGGVFVVSNRYGSGVFTKSGAGNAVIYGSDGIGDHLKPELHGSGNF